MRGRLVCPSHGLLARAHEQEGRDSCVKIRRTVIFDTVQWIAGLWIGLNETLIRHGEPRLLVLVFSGLWMNIPTVAGLVRLYGTTGEKVNGGRESQSSSVSS